MNSQLSSMNTASPEITRTTETFVEHVAIGGESRRVEFEKPIVWLLESETQILFRHGAEVVKAGSTYNDWYGLMTSIKGAMEDAVRLVKFYNVTQASSLEILLVTKVMHTPVFETAETIAENKKRPANYRRMYMNVPNAWRQERIEDGQKLWPNLAPRILATEDVWSSLKSEQDNATFMADFISKWKNGVPEA